MMKIKEIPIEERPREKLLKYGANNLSDSELLSIILKTGTKNINVIDMSLNLLKSVNGLNNLYNCSFSSLSKIKGIGSAKAIELLALSEICKRMYYKKDSSLIKYNNPKSIYENTKYLFSDLKQEHFYCLYLDNNKKLIDKKLLFIGTLNQSIVHPREIFKEAYKLSASSIICIHNHPSGDLTPSIEDISLTKSLVEIGKLNAIPIIDHLIVSDSNYYSFYENRVVNI